MKKSLAGARVAITGAARGIGLATAKQFAAGGARVIIGDLDAELSSRAAAEIGPDVRGLGLDVTDRASYQAFLASATSEGPLDVLVNNAGVMPIGPFTEMSPATYQRAVEINVLGYLHGMHLALPSMSERRSGHIVNVASTAGKAAVPGGLAYCATKAAVVAMTETARIEYAGTGVDFTCVMPHFTNTDLIDGTVSTKLIPTVEASDVAKSIVEAVTKGKKDAYVPAMIGTMLAAQPLMGRGLRDFVNRKLGAYDTFLHFDPEARRAYDARIERS